MLHLEVTGTAVRDGGTEGGPEDARGECQASVISKCWSCVTETFGSGSEVRGGRKCSRTRADRPRRSLRSATTQPESEHRPCPTEERETQEPIEIAGPGAAAMESSDTNPKCRPEGRHYEEPHKKQVPRCARDDSFIVNQPNRRAIGSGTRWRRAKGKDPRATTAGRAAAGRLADFV
jgi:hypothetical protein